MYIAGSEDSKPNLGFPFMSGNPASTSARGTPGGAAPGPGLRSAAPLCCGCYHSGQDEQAGGTAGDRASRKAEVECHQMGSMALHS